MRQIVLFGLLALGACQVPAAETAPPTTPPPATPSTSAPPPVISVPPPAPMASLAREEPTRILSQRDADRLLGNSGITLQWITWDSRGPVSVDVDEHGVWHLHGQQTGTGGAELKVDGTITEIGDGYFTLQGTVAIANTPDPGRFCEQAKPWHFAITQGRKYYRLREFEWCDELTDYVDIYF